MITFATKELQIPANRIILWGRSLGSGPTVNMAMELATAKPPVQIAGAFSRI